MKTVKEIKQEYAEFGSTNINSAVGTNHAICALYRHIIGITEHLEAQAQGPKPGATFVRLDGSVYRMDRCGTEEEHAEFLRSGKVPADAVPVVHDGITGDIVALDDATVKAIRREAWVEALRWAIIRLEEGGEL